MRPASVILAALLVFIAAPASANSPPLPVQARLPAAEQAAIFRAAGFVQRRGQWRGCDDPGTVGYTPGAIEQYRDVNGDGLPEAVVTEGSTACYGIAETGYVVVSKQRGGAWRRINGGQGIATFLPGRTPSGWPDIEVGGPGFCFPVERWNGREYALHRYQYEGRRCSPRR